jgi:S1-C subfamily serine protease
LEASLGIVGALGGGWRTALRGRVARTLRTNARPFPGFSGGPLLTPAGVVLGVNTAALTREGAATLPTESVRRVVETLRAHGRVRRGHLGVGGQPVGLPEALREHAGQGAGLLVTSVQPDTPAAAAGLMVGDILLRFGEARVRHPGQLAALLDEEVVGQTVGVTLARPGALTELSVTVAERP